MTIITPDHLTLEVEVPPAGLPNLIANPNGEFGAWGWISDTDDTTMDGTGTDLVFVTTVSQLTGVTTEAFPVTPGDYLAARIDVTAGTAGHTIALGFAYLDADKTPTFSLVTSSYPADVVATRYHAPGEPVPAGAVYAQLILGLSKSGGAADAFSGVTWTKSMVTEDDTDPGSAFAYVEPITWQDITDDGLSIEFERHSLDVGSMTVVASDDALDPAATEVLRPGRAVRFSADGEVMFTGRQLDPTAEYDKAKLSADVFPPRVTVLAVDAVAALAAEPEPRGVGGIGELPYILEGHGTPWNIGGYTGHAVAAASIESMDPDASVIDQVALTRDTNLAHVYVSREGVLTLTVNPEASGVTLSDSEDPSYTDIRVGFDPSSAINLLTVTLLTYDPATGTTVEWATGPYRDALSIREWGQKSRTIRINKGEPALYAGDVLAVCANPAKLVRSFTIAVETLADLVTVRALEPTRTLDVTWGGTTYTVRVASVRHTIRPTTDMRRPVAWLATYDCEPADTIARPWR